MSAQYQTDSTPRTAKTAAIFLTAALTVFVSGFVARAVACPFCSAVSQTIRQEMEVMDAVVIAEATGDSVRNERTGELLVKVIDVLQGEDHVKPDSALSIVYFGKVEPGRRFMLSGVDPPDMQWSIVPLTEESEAYVRRIPDLPDDSLERLKFFKDFLEHPESLLNRDAYDEFAITPYPVIQSLEPYMDREQLIEWIKEPEMSADRKRLYLTMLGVCGSEADLPMLEEMLTGTQPNARSGLDALVGCYLTLAGEEGLELINKLFLANHQAAYADTYAAIMAIRFHGTEGGVIARSALIPSLHHVLDRKDLADLVIPDLARWGDWSQIDRLVKMFIEADKDNNWIRVPVVNYLRACPKPEAEEALEKLKEVDPDSVRRAGAFFTVPTPKPDPASSSRTNLPKSDNDYAALSPAAPSAGLLAAGNGSAGPLSAELAAASSARESVGDAGFTANRSKIACVTASAVASLVISLYLVLTGGGKAVPLSVNSSG